MLKKFSKTFLELCKKLHLKKEEKKMKINVNYSETVKLTEERRNICAATLTIAFSHSAPKSYKTETQTPVARYLNKRRTEMYKKGKATGNDGIIVNLIQETGETTVESYKHF